MRFSEIIEKYGLQGEFFVNAIKDEIHFYEKKRWEWNMKIIKNDKHAMIVALICKDGTTFYTFSKFHRVYAGCFTISTTLMEELMEKSEDMWERELKCLESNLV